MMRSAFTLAITAGIAFAQPASAKRSRALHARVVWDGSGERLALLAEPERVFVLARDGRLLHELACEGRTLDVAFSHDRRLLATAGSQACLFSVADGRLLQTAKARRVGGYLRAAFSPDDRLLALATDTSVELFDVANESLSLDRSRHHIATPPAGMRRLAFHPRGEQLATAGSLSEQPGATAAEPIRIWNARNGQAFTTLDGAERAILALEYTSRGDLLALDRNGSLRVWQSGQPPARDIVRGSATGAIIGTFALSSNGVWVAAGGSEGKVEVFEIESGRRIAAFAVRDEPITELRFAEREPWLAAVDRRGEVRVYDLTSGVVRAAASIKDAAAGGLQFRPTGALLDVARSIGAVRTLAW